MSPVPRLPATRCTAEDVFADTALARLDPSPANMFARTRQWVYRNRFNFAIGAGVVGASTY